MTKKLYIVDKTISKDEFSTWSTQKREHVKMSEEIRSFLIEYEELCRKHNITLSHEDGHGAFLIDDFSESNIEWVSQASDDRLDKNKFQF